MNSYYNDSLYPLQDRVLKAIQAAQTPFYLTGGTALSRCYFNHRYSDDLGFFVNKDKNFLVHTEKIIVSLADFELEIKIKTEGFCSLMVNKILKLDLVDDVAFHLGGFETHEIFNKVDNIENILSNKLSALISREEAKDVVDIWMIAKGRKINWQEIYLSVGSKAAGIFPPEVAKKLDSFPRKLLSKIKWVGESPSQTNFDNDIKEIVTSILAV
mgnify:CR=1 FL=1